MKLLGGAATLLSVFMLLVSGSLLTLLDDAGNYLERTVEYFSGQSARTELHHASSASTWGGHMATITVSSTAQLISALGSAKAGDIVLLAPGTYAGVDLHNLNFSSAVTITSADPSHPAKLVDLTINSSSGLTLTNLELDGTSATVIYPFQVLSSSNIELSHLWIHGSLDGNPTDDPNLLIVRNSSNVTVEDSNFEQGSNGLSFLDDDHLQFLDNSFHDLNTDGIHGGGSSYVTISGNTFTNFYPTVGGNHPDAIQFWTTNTTTAAHDIVVTNNVIVRGSGGAMQGIFITDQVGNLPYSNVTITGNVLAGTMFNGIMVQDALNVTVSENTVAGYPDMKSWIRLEQVDGGLVSNNIAGELIEKSDSNLTVVNETQVVPTTVAQATDYVTNWLAAHADIASVYDGSSTGIDLTGSTTGGTTGTTTTGTTTTGTTTTGTTTGGTTGGTGTTTGGTGTTTGGTGTTTGGTTGTTTGGTTGSTTGGTTGTTTGGSTTGTTAGGTSNSGSTDSGSAGPPRHFPHSETKTAVDQAAVTASSSGVAPTDNTQNGTSHLAADQFVFGSAGQRGVATSANVFTAAELDHNATGTISLHGSSPAISTFAAAPMASPLDEMHVFHVVDHLFS